MGLNAFFFGVHFPFATFCSASDPSKGILDGKDHFYFFFFIFFLLLYFWGNKQDIVFILLISSKTWRKWMIKKLEKIFSHIGLLFSYLKKMLYAHHFNYII